MTERLVNPIASFYLEGEEDKPEAVIAITDLFGETGEQVEIVFTDPGYIKSISDMLNNCADDLFDAKSLGIMHVVNRKGMQTDDAMTIEDIIDNDD